MFRPRLTASDDRSPYGNFWFEPIGVHTLSGVRVNSDSAMRLAAVYRCVDIVAKTFAVLPFGLFKPRKAGGRDAQTDHWLYKLIGLRPNAFQDPFMWRQMVMAHIALRGNAYNRIYANGRGIVTDLIPQHPDRVRIELLPNGEYRYRIRQADGSEEVVPRGMIWHLRGLSMDGITGLSTIGYAREAIGRGLGAQQYGAQYFANSGGPTGGWIELPNKFSTQGDRDNFTESWQNARTGPGRHKTPVLEGGMKFHELGIRNDEAQFIETMKFSVTDICRFFGVPPHLVYDLDRSTNNNIEQQSLDFVTYTVMPNSSSWVSSIQYEFLDDDSGLVPDFDLRALLKADTTTRGNFYKTMFNVGAYSPNDIRIGEGGNPVAGGNQRFIPVNMTVLKPNMQPPPAPTPFPSKGKPEDGEDGEDPEDESDQNDQQKGNGKDKGKNPKGSRAMALVIAAADRVARREVGLITKAWRAGGADAVAKAYADHARFVSDALAVTPESAAAYCALRLTQMTTQQELSDFETIARCQLELLAANGTL